MHGSQKNISHIPSMFFYWHRNFFVMEWKQKGKSHSMINNNVTYIAMWFDHSVNKWNSLGRDQWDMTRLADLMYTGSCTLAYNEFGYNEHLGM